MYDWIVKNGYEPIIIATKLDKINRSQKDKCVKIIRQALHLGAERTVIPFSAQTKQGKEEIYETIDKILEDRD